MSDGSFKPWTYTDLWDNESQFLTWLRGQLRQIWSDYPVRVEFLNAACVTVDDEMRIKYGLSKQTKKAGQCVFCGHWFPKSKLQCDHKVGNKSMRSVSEIFDYIKHLLCSPDDLQLVCVPCHKIKSYSESSGKNFEEARVEKSVIAWLNEHDVDQQKFILMKAGFSDDEIKNAGNRRKAIRQLLSKENG